MRYLLGALATLSLILTATAALAQAFEWEGPLSRGVAGRSYFDQEHHEEYVREALHELTGTMPRPDATREELAAIVLGVLDTLPVYGERQVAMVPPPIPEWFLDGYQTLEPTSVSHSRYLDGVLAGEMAPSADIGALYSFWCVYDAEWFSLSRHADHKAWLSAVLLHFPPQWNALKGESETGLHNRLVWPLQTPDEPFREIDNWINNFTKYEGAFAKPKVRDALVQELITQGGLEGDVRYFDDSAYDGPAPGHLGLSERQFYLLAALSLEYFAEIYEQDPDAGQLGHFRDYFVGVLHYQLGR